MHHQRPLNKTHNYQIINGDDDGLISYVFMSSNGAYYSVYFNVKEYDQFTENYPNLFSNGYGLGIFRVTKPVTKIKKDIFLFPTIEAILHEFINRVGDDAVLLFHCDSSDGRQAARDKLFTHWFEISDKKDGFIRDRFEAVIQETDIKHFMGYITSINNPNLRLVQLEFDACAFNLMQDKISGVCVVKTQIHFNDSLTIMSLVNKFSNFIKFKTLSLFSAFIWLTRQLRTL